MPHNADEPESSVVMPGPETKTADTDLPAVKTDAEAQTDSPNGLAP